MTIAITIYILLIYYTKRSEAMLNIEIRLTGIIIIMSLLAVQLYYQQNMQNFAYLRQYMKTG